MSETLLISVMKDALVTAVKVSAPILVTAIVIGLVISILQATTQIQEQTLTFVPKLLAIFAVLALFGSFIFNKVNNFTIELFSNFSKYIK